MFYHPGPYVRPACMPSAHEHFDNLVCTATGWGAMIKGELTCSYEILFYTVNDRD